MNSEIFVMYISKVEYATCNERNKCQVSSDVCMLILCVAYFGTPWLEIDRFRLLMYQLGSGDTIECDVITRAK